LKAPPTGIVTVNDLLAIGLIAGLRDVGVRVPEDVSIVGMDNLFLSSLIGPALTSVSAPLTEIADTMVTRIVTRLADPQVAPIELLFEPVLMRRSTVAVLSSGHAERPAMPFNGTDRSLPDI
jgi:DNA-binding LacI/PurR family transcriptional regulator